MFGHFTTLWKKGLKELLDKYETVNIQTRVLKILVTEIIKVKIRESPTVMY